MSFWERLQTAVGILFRLQGGAELPKTGRSSDETMGGSLTSYLANYGSVNPVIDFQMLKALKHFRLFNPDVSQYVANIVQLGNPGHTISVEAASDATAEAAAERLNESASRIYTHGCGVDGLLNQYLDSIAWSGAISSEDVVNLAGRRVEKVVLVPVEQIRFVYDKETDNYEPYQRSSGLGGLSGRNGHLGLIKLNPETYRYLALSTVENSPYAKPPATAAVEAILTGQEPIMQNIRWMAQKVGLMGLVAVGVAEPRKKGGETDAEHAARAQTHLTDFAAALDGNFNKGLVVVPKEHTFEHTPVTSGAQGVYEINRISEEQVFSGLAAMPGFHGRTDSTTETFADVVYYLLTAQVANIQRVVKRRQEATYRLDLRLGGIDVDSVSLTFNKAHSRNAKAEAETDKIVLDTVLSKVKNGVITPDEGAQELGYESWADEVSLGSPDSLGSLGSLGKRRTENGKRRTLRLSFDKGKQKYIYRPEVLQISNGEFRMSNEAGGNVVPLVKKKARAAGASN